MKITQFKYYEYNENKITRIINVFYSKILYNLKNISTDILVSAKY